MLGNVRFINIVIVINIKVYIVYNPFPVYLGFSTSAFRFISLLLSFKAETIVKNHLKFEL